MEADVNLKPLRVTEITSGVQVGMTMETVGDTKVISDPRLLARALRWAWFHVPGFPRAYEWWHASSSRGASDE